MPNSETRHRIQRIRQEPKRRRLTVAEAFLLTPRMKRIVFVSPDLHDFASHGADDHIKLFFADPVDPGQQVMRDYTPRAFDGTRLTIDFALHDDGPATAWAMAAKAGDMLEIGGPRGSMVVADDFDWYLLVGDETALPAIGRRIETLRAHVPVSSFVLIDSHEEIQRFTTQADHEPHWLLRADPASGDGDRLLAALAGWRAPPGEGYVWIAAEASLARAAKRYMLEERGHNPAFLKSAGYWVRGEAGAHEKG